MTDTGTAPCPPHALSGPLHGLWQLVHGPLAHWAQHTPQAIALQCGEQRMDFQTLYQHMLSGSHALTAAQAPAMLLVDSEQPVLERIVAFLAIIHSGRCAAIGDAQWPPAVQAAMQAAVDQAAQATATAALGPAHAHSAFYTGFTSGSSGVPKGFMRHHQSWTESFRVCLQDFGPVAGQRILAPGSLSHSLFLFGVMLGLWCGAGAVVQTRFSAARCLQHLALGDTPCLVAVPSQLLLMLQLARRRRLPAIHGVQLVMISGARWMRAHTAALQALFPQARIVEFYGASETSFITWMDADTTAPPQAVGRAFSNVELDIRALPSAGADTANGTIYVRSPMLFMDYVGQARDSTAVLRDGDWLSVRDIGHIDHNGLLCLVGREQRMLVTQGKNLFPEEVEAWLCEHPDIAQASVQGVADPLRGLQLHAMLQWRAAAPAATPLTRPDALQLGQWCRSQLEAYKAPKRWWTCSPWPQTASGKTDHNALAQALARALHTDGAPQATAGMPLAQAWQP